jgi:3-dehydroquinate synthetase
LIYAAALSERFSGLSTKDVALHRLVLDSLGLPTSYIAGAWDSLYELMLRDKKSRSTLRFVTLTSIGKPTRLENPGVEALKEIYEREIGR